jgi:hypothetical protein
VWAVVTGADPLEPTLAAGSIVLQREQRRARLAAAAVPVHVALSVGLAIVLERVLTKPNAVTGAASGLGILALDLGVVGRRFPRVAAPPVLPQLADHLVYGATVGYVLARRRR